MANAVSAMILMCGCDDHLERSGDGAGAPPAGSVVAAHRVAPTVSTRLLVDVRGPRADGRSLADGRARVEGRPGLAVCVDFDGRHRCYPGGKKVTGPACADAVHCELSVDVPPTGELGVEVWAADASHHELLARGSCAVGKTCELEGSTVELGAQRQLQGVAGDRFVAH